LPNGLFWIVKVPDSAVQISPDGNTLTIHLENVPVVDTFMFPPPVPSNIASDEVNISPYQLIRARTSFDITYTKTPGTARRIRPETDDPLSPLNWAGKMWDATNSGTFSVSYDDGSFSASGSFASSRNFGEMGTERNGFFVRHEVDDEDDEVAAESQSHGFAGVIGSAASLPASKSTPPSQLAANEATKPPEGYALLKGRFPIKISH
jgi:hypothetical protein